MTRFWSPRSHGLSAGARALLDAWRAAGKPQKYEFVEVPAPAPYEERASAAPSQGTIAPLKLVGPAREHSVHNHAGATSVLRSLKGEAG
jgi:hypothetical protein